MKMLEHHCQGEGVQRRVKALLKCESSCREEWKCRIQSYTERCIKGVEALRSREQKRMNHIVSEGWFSMQIKRKHI